MLYYKHVCEVKHGIFSLLVLTTSEGMDKQVIDFYKQAPCLLLSVKKGHALQPCVCNWLDQMPHGSLSALILRGTRSIAGFVPQTTYPEVPDLTISCEGQAPPHI